MNHSSVTIDRLNTFHGMGIVVYVTNPSKCPFPEIKGGIISSNDTVEMVRMKTKLLNFYRDLKPLKMFRELLCNAALNNTKAL